MSKARLVITAVVTEGRSQGEVARAYGVSQGWVSRLVARYRAEGEAAFEPRSRRPKTSPRAIPHDVADLIIQLRKELAGQLGSCPLGRELPATRPMELESAVRGGAEVRWGHRRTNSPLDLPPIRNRPQPTATATGAYGWWTRTCESE